METIQYSTGIENQTLEQLRTKMGPHSNTIISNILTFSQEAELETKDQIEKQIKEHIIAFLKQKAAIKSDYEGGDDNGEAYHYDNREKYRQKMVKLIGDILQYPIDKNIGENIKNAKDALIQVLENDGR